MRNSQFMRGLGLVEIMIGVVVIGIIAAVAAPSFSDMLNRRRVKAVAADISTDMAYLRSEALTRPSPVTLWMYQDPLGKGMSCYAIGYANGGGDCKNCWDDAAPCTPGVAGVAVATKTVRVPISDKVSFKGSSVTAQPVATQGSLTASPPRATVKPVDYYVDVCGSTTASPRAVLRIELNSSGRPHTCTPNHSMSGYGDCTITATPQCPTPQ